MHTLVLLVTLLAITCLAAGNAAAAAAAPRPAPVELTIGAEPGSDVSPRLFGHNLEVTRRGIWEGLGAEMVANRKFAAMDGAAPRRWQPLGGAMLAVDADARFAAPHSLRITVAGGSGFAGVAQEQEALSLQAATAYTVRLWARAAAKRALVARLVDAADGTVLWSAGWTVRPGDWRRMTWRFRPARACARARLEIGSAEAGAFHLGAVSLQRADALRGMRRDVIAALRQLRPASLRFPGGCYAEFYRWQDGLLDIDRRPCIGPTGLPFLHPATDDVDTQEMGTDEFMALCRSVGCEPALTVRLSENSPEDAAAWVEYCNGAADTPWGAVRARRGHAAPYGVRTWFLGNELYAFGRGGMNDAAQCAERTRLFAAAMRRVDPSITLVGCTQMAPGAWNRALLEHAGDAFDLCSVHDYLLDDFTGDIGAMARAPLTSLKPLLLAVRTAFERDGAAPGQRRLALDEWNSLWGRPGSVGMALYAAGVLNLLVREADTLAVEQALYFMPINEGGVRVTPTAASLAAAGQVFALFAPHQAGRRLTIAGASEEGPVDAAASLSADGRRIHVTFVNRDAGAPVTVVVRSGAWRMAGRAQAQLLTPATLQADSQDLATSRPVVVRRTDGALLLDLPPGGIAGVALPVKRDGRREASREALAR